MSPQERENLTHLVGRYAAINAKIQELKWEQKELADAAWEKAGVKPAVVKQLAKETAWDEVKRQDRKLFEEALDECRAALGLLADTPLGQAAQSASANEQPNANGVDRQAPRGRGRPKGSKNKPKLSVVENEPAGTEPLSPPPPPVPEAPTAPELPSVA